MAEIYPELERRFDELFATHEVELSAGMSSAAQSDFREELLNAAKESYRQQFQDSYHYLVGEWAGSRKSKSSRTGDFVPNSEVIEYLGGTAP